MNLNKTLLSGLFWVLLVNLLIKPFWILGIEVPVQNAVGDAEYGLYFSIFSLAYILNIVLDLGINNFNTRNISQHPQLVRKHFSSVFTLKFMLLLLYLVATLTLGLIRGFDSREFLLLLFISINQSLCSLIAYLRSNYEALLLFRWDSIISVLDRLLMIIICGSLLFYNKHTQSFDFKIEWFVYAQTVAYIITLLIALIVLFRKMGRVSLKVNKAFSLVILKRSAPFALLVFLMSCYNRLDPVLLTWILPDEVGNSQAGIYASAFRLLDALTMIAYLVSVPLLPVFSKMLNESQQLQENLSDTTQWVFSMMMAFAIGVSVTFSFMSNQLMALLYDMHVEASTQVFRILIFNLIPVSVTYVFGTLLTANGNMKALNLLASLSLILNIAINLWLIPRWGAVGSAWSSLITQSFMAFTQMAVAIHLFRFEVPTNYFIRILGFILIVVGINMVIYYCCPALSWWLILLVMFIASLGAALLFHLIDIVRLRSIMDNKD